MLRSGDVPVNFLSTVDTTGGNSGSPTLNGKGELVGLLFDGTYESVASNYLFDPATTRSIHVDSRYMLWNMAEVDGAINLLQEMSIPGFSVWCAGAFGVSAQSIGGFRRTTVVRMKGMAGFGWWALLDLNQRPTDYESAALTAELRAQSHLIITA